MTNIALEISIDGDKCGDDCMFRESSFLAEIGGCLLFSERLKPKYKHGYVDYWKRCNRCSSINLKEEQL